MEKWKCTICGYVHEGPITDDFTCPMCGMGREFFEKVEDDSPVEEQHELEKVIIDGVEKWRCTICGYIHEGPITDDFTCPMCGMGREFFEKVEDEPFKEEKQEEHKLEKIVIDGVEKWRCTICGYIHEGPITDDFTCPMCGMGREFFEKVEDDSPVEEQHELEKVVIDGVEKWRCTICGYIHEGPITDDFVCPLCGMGREYFEKVEEPKETEEEHKLEKVVIDGVEKWRCTICGYIHEGPISDDFVCPLCGMGREYFEKVEDDKKEEVKDTYVSKKHMPLDVRVAIELDNPSIMRHEDLCIKCGQCKDVCEKQIAVHGTYNLLDTNDTAMCINCGQCANVCPTNSITEKYEYQEVSRHIKDSDKIVIFSTSPSVRVGLGEEFGLDSGTFVQGKMVSLLRSLGADYVLDTNFAADLTIVEEASELIERITNGGKLPQFTSCCPAWVKYVETYYPEFMDNLSSVKSPIGMQGPTIKTYFAKKMGIDPTKIINVAVTPCTAKKMEIRRGEMNDAGKFLGIDDMRDMDYVITTRELAKWAKEEGIDFNSLVDSDFDNLMGEASGAGVIFANTGGVMEAAIRTAYEYITKEACPDTIMNLEPVRGYEGIREATLDIKGLKVRVAVVYGTANAKKLLDALKSGEKEYDFVEVMTCPGGCIGGGGQPKNFLKKADDIRKARIASIYNKDKSMTIRKSHENPDIIKVYEEFYGKPLSELSHKMLHTMYEDKSKNLKGEF